MEKISWWLENFLFVNANNILRIKGILSIDDMQHKLALQSVGDNFHILQGNAWQDNEKRVSRLVFIGSKLDKDEIHKNLYSLITNSSKIKALSNQDK
jgi:G3E family GTPase